jgi:hypothetical protein
VVKIFEKKKKKKTTTMILIHNYPHFLTMKGATLFMIGPTHLRFKKEGFLKEGERERERERESI